MIMHNDVRAKKKRTTIATRIQSLVAGVGSLEQGSHSPHHMVAVVGNRSLGVVAGNRPLGVVGGNHPAVGGKSVSLAVEDRLPVVVAGSCPVGVGSPLEVDSCPVGVVGSCFVGVVGSSLAVEVDSSLVEAGSFPAGVETNPAGMDSSPEVVTKAWCRREFF